MIKKLYDITIAFEDKENGYSANVTGYTVLATTAEEAIKKLPKLAKDEFVDEIKNIRVIDIE